MLQLINTFINIIISQMPGSRKHAKKQCTKHTFQLKPKSHTCFYQQPININFCDKSGSKPKGQKNKTVSCYEGPIFNKDNNYLTSSFIISSEKKKYVQNVPIVENQNKYYNFHQEKSQILVPKPNSKNMYCNVCKQKYEDYQQHIQQIKHKKKIQNSSFNNYILQFQNKYKLKRSALKLKQKQLTLTQASNVIIIDESQDELEQISKPSKKVKREKMNEMIQGQTGPKFENRYINNSQNAIYEQIIHRLRTSYWNLVQSNYLPMHYPGFYPPLGLASPYPIEAPIPFNHYNPHNSSIELINPYFYPYNLSYHSKGVDPRMGIGTNVGVGVGMQGSLGIQQNLVGQPMGLINNS